MTVNGSTAGAASVEVGQPVSFETYDPTQESLCVYPMYWHCDAEGCFWWYENPPPNVYTSYGDGTSESGALQYFPGSGSLHTYLAPGQYTVEAVAACDGCPGAPWTCAGCPGAQFIQVAAAAVQATQPCTNSPPYSPPPELTEPPVQRVMSVDEDLVNPGDLAPFGVTVIETETDSECEQICQNGQTAYRLRGRFTTEPSTYFAQVATTIQYGQCAVANRTETNILRTINHELVHAQRLVAVRNAFISRFGAVYATEDACISARQALIAEIADARVTEFRRQLDHVDHLGERRFRLACDAPGMPTREIACGIENPSCNPDFY
jgi:hypothetical protein